MAQWLRVIPKDDPTDRIELEVGDSKDLVYFQPQLKLMRWDNEANFSVRLLGQQVGLANVVIEGDVIKWILPSLEIHWYPIFANGEFPAGGYEFEIILKDPPPAGKVQFQLEHKEFDFHYQPPLTQQQIDEGHEAPEWAIGSYAVYHVAKGGDYTRLGGKNYRTGKAFHIHRPKIFDSVGNWTWGELDVNPAEKKLTITIPQAFLDSVTYPVTIDPTFGYEDQGAATYTIQNKILGSKYTISEDGTGTSMSFWSYGYYGTAKVKCAIYKTSDNSLVGATLEGTRGGGNGYGSDLTTVDFSEQPSLVSGTEYYLVAWGQTIAGDNKMHYDSLVGGGCYDNETFDGFPAPLVPTSFDLKCSIYCTYEEAGAAYYHGLKVQGEGELALCDVGNHPLRIRKGGTTYGIELVATDDPNASRVRIKTPAGIKAIRKYT